jgi:hypothetical protein
MQRIVILMMVLVLATVNTMPVAASDDGPVSSSFSLKVPPALTGLQVFTDSSLTTVATGLQPTQTYWVKVSVTDNDGLNDLTSLKVVMFYSEAGEPTISTVDWKATYATSLPETLEVLMWDRETNAITHTLDGTTWVVSETAEHPLPTADKIAPGTTTTSYDFVFQVKIGKVAEETANTNINKWQVAALALDANDYITYSIFSNNSVFGLSMDWYGEILLPSSAIIDWGPVKSGLLMSEAAAAEAPSVDGIPVTIGYISNGDYSDGVKVTSSNLTWKAGTSGVTLKTNHLNAANTFSLKVKKGLPAKLVGAIPVWENSNVAFTSEKGIITSEEGMQDGNYTVYLGLSNNITYPGTYTGAINFVIANR